MLYALGLSGQNTSELSRSYYPVAASMFSIEDGMFDNCVQITFQKNNGALILIPCTHVQNSQKIYAYEYDGFDSYNLTLDIPELGTRFKIIPCTQDYQGVQYGYITNELNSTTSPFSSKSCLFEYNPSSDTWKFTFLRSAEGDTLNIRNVYSNEHDLYILGTSNNGIEVITRKNNTFKSELIYGIDKLEGIFEHPVKFLVTDHQFWIINNQNLFHVYDRRQKILKTIPFEVKAEYNVHILDRITLINGLPPLFTNSLRGKVYSIDTASFQINPFWPRFLRQNDNTELYIHSDRSGNTLFITVLDDIVQECVLLQEDGSYSNFKEVGDKFSDYSNGNFNHINLSGTDFRKEIYVTGASLGVIEVSSKELIETIPSGASRAITYIGNDKLLINNSGTYDLKKESFVKKLNVFCLDTISLNPDCNIIDKNNEELICSAIDDRLLIIDLVAHNCQLFQMNARIRRMVLSDMENLIAIEGRKLVEINLKTGNSTSLLDSEIDAFVNDMVFNYKGDLLLATSNGLFKWTKNSRSLEYIDIKGQINEQQVIDILIDQYHNIWLATFSQGIKVLNSDFELIMEINEDRGLSNNIVVSLLEDNSGNIWAGTYNGITILNADGTIFGQVFDSDGLINNECNRWSSLKLKDGRLCFGSVEGVSIINTEEIKNNIHERKHPQIYLSQIDFNETQLKIGQTEFLETINKGIKLTAGNRNLILSYALSNYAQPNESTFAYKIDQENQDWHYIGSMHKLYLHNLPKGKYDVLIKGYDFRGQESSNVVSIPLTVAPFFYTTWWFYLLVAAPFIFFTYLWMLRQRSEKQRLESEVLLRTQTIREQSEALKEMDMLKSKLYTNITHEFRTPLTVITGLSDRIYEDDKAQEMIKRNASNLLNLVNQMLELQKLEAGKLSPEYIKGDLVAYLSYLGESIRSMAELKGIKFHFLAPRDPVIIDFDPEKIRRVITNLLSNSIKFTPKGGDIYLHVEDINPDDQIVKIHIRDNGIGIAPENLDKIFDRYFQESTNHNLQSNYGTGIGLALVKEIIQLFGGTITVSSKPGSGAIFSIAIPISQKARLINVKELFTEQQSFHHSHINEVSIADLENKEQIADRKEATILIVEDNPDVIHYIGSCLKEKYYLYIAMNGQDGIDKAIAEVPDLIISDVMMPLKDGYELCNVIKQDERTSHIPIILLTAKADIDSKIMGITKGADAYLPKPFHEKELQAYISQLILQRKKLQERYQSFYKILPADDEAIQQEDKFILKFTNLLLDQIENEDLGVTEMAIAFRISRNQLHNKVKALTGQSVSQYMRHIRLSEALKLMEDKNLSVSEIAYKVGFKDPKYFGRVFKEVFGKSPSEYIETL